VRVCTYKITFINSSSCSLTILGGTKNKKNLKYCFLRTKITCSSQIEFASNTCIVLYISKRSLIYFVLVQLDSAFGGIPKLMNITIYTTSRTRSSYIYIKCIHWFMYIYIYAHTSAPSKNSSQCSLTLISAVTKIKIKKRVLKKNSSALPI